MTARVAAAVVLAAAVGCAPKARRQESARPQVATRVALRALEADASGNVPRLRAPCPADLSLRELTCPVQPAVLEVAFSGDGHVVRSRIARSSGIQALDLGCMLAANSCVLGHSSKQASLECSLQCE